MNYRLGTLLLWSQNDDHHKRQTILQKTCHMPALGSLLLHFNHRGTKMSVRAPRQDRRRLRAAIGASVIASMTMGTMPVVFAADSDAAVDHLKTASPIKHAIVIIGENRSFDHVFGLYKPRHEQRIKNLLSEGIVKADGTPGPNFNKALQSTVDPQPHYFISPPTKKAFSALPTPLLNGTPNVASDANPPPFATVAAAAAAEPALEAGDIHLLTTGASGLAVTEGVDPRVPSNLRPGPFQMTGELLPYDAYTGDTIHRFFQMWQQSDCDIHNATRANPSGCLSDLYPFVTTTFNGGKDGGGWPMAFLNVNQGDAPFLKRLADEFTMSDNYHQPAMGGTGIQHNYLGMADNVFFTDETGKAIPPSPFLVANPDPQPGSNNHYKGDILYANCSDPTQPGIAPIVNYLASLSYNPATKCAAGNFYLLNNLFPAFNADGTRNPAAVHIGPFTVPITVGPQSVPSIGDEMAVKNVPFKYYGGGYNDAVAGKPNAFCPICNPFQYEIAYKDNAFRNAHTGDVVDLFTDIQNNALPAVSFVKPDGLLDGHPDSSKLNLFEAFVKDILDRLHANPKAFADTAVFITFDEGGGYYDSGYIQPLDFFGDGPRIPMIVVSPFSRGGRIVHSYTDHASVVKFIERNWRLGKLSGRSRDNLANPITDDENPYVPVNAPAIGDLFDMFQFDGDRDRHDGDRDDHADRDSDHGRRDNG
jgi:phospholipase C